MWVLLSSNANKTQPWCWKRSDSEVGIKWLPSIKSKQAETNPNPTIDTSQVSQSLLWQHGLSFFAPFPPAGLPCNSASLPACHCNPPKGQNCRKPHIWVMNILPSNIPRNKEQNQKSNAGWGDGNSKMPAAAAQDAAVGEIAAVTGRGSTKGFLHLPHYQLINSYWTCVDSFGAWLCKGICFCLILRLRPKNVTH